MQIFGQQPHTVVEANIDFTLRLLRFWVRMFPLSEKALASTKLPGGLFRKALTLANRIDGIDSATTARLDLACSKFSNLI